MSGAAEAPDPRPVYMGVDPVCGCPWMWCVPPEEIARRDPRFAGAHVESTADALAGAILDGAIVERAPYRAAVKGCVNCAARRKAWDDPPGLPTGESLYRVRIPVSLIVLAKDASDAESLARRSLEFGGFHDVEPEVGETAHVAVVRDAEGAGKDWLESAPLVDDNCDLTDDELPGDGTVGAILAAYGPAPAPTTQDVDPNQMALPFETASTGT